MIEALAQSMRQLQELQLKALQKDSPSEETPEAVKTSVATLAVLGLPEGDQSGLLFQDWLVQITTAMQDLSAGSGSWWELVKTSVMKAYETWLAATPLERLGIEPQNSSELITGKWVRVNARSCAVRWSFKPSQRTSSTTSLREELRSLCRFCSSDCTHCINPGVQAKGQ